MAVSKNTLLLGAGVALLWYLSRQRKLGQQGLGALPSPYLDSVERLRQVRQRPGYGIPMLRQYQGTMHPGVLDVELLRLREQEDHRLSRDPITFSLTQLQRAYEDDDIPAIRRWENAVVTAGGRRYLEGVKARARSYRARGLQGVSGLGG
jgi:hypothetical protein